MTRSFAWTGVAIVAAVWGSGCVLNPATGHRQLSLYNEVQEIELGRQAQAEVEAAMGLASHDPLQQMVRETGAALAAVSERPHLPWSFQMVDEPGVNAFALPGGPVYVTRGLVAHLNSRAELAAVLGHEIGHITARHSVHQMSKAQLAGIGLELGGVLEPEVARYAPLAGAGLGLLLLKHSRDDERQADDLGLRYLESCGFDGQAMTRVFRLLSLTGSASEGSRLPAWMATHPAPESRAARMRNALGDDTWSSPAQDAAWLQRLDGLIYGPDPRHGFFRNGWFLHPQQLFRLRLPDGWEEFNQRASAGALEPEGRAVLELSLAREETAVAAAEAFFGDGSRRRGAAWRSRMGGQPAVSAFFTAASAAEDVSGLIAFVDLEGSILVMRGMALSSSWPRYRHALEQALASFSRRLEDRDRQVRPRRLALVRTARATTLAAHDREFPSVVALSEVALLNRRPADAPLPQGTWVKRVLGGP